MYSNKKNVLELVALMRAHHIFKVVVSPGSRNAPIIETFAQHPEFECFSVVDERSAAFFALGLIQQSGKPVAVCCTSGTALLNFGSAVAEAFYQQLPLLVISADRPQEWIGQMDGQTLPQPNVFGSLVKRSVQLPEPKNEQEEWYCNRLINEALIELTHHVNGPVHINVPISDPLFEFSATVLPNVRVISLNSTHTEVTNQEKLAEQWSNYSRKMVIVGQLLPDEKVRKKIQQLASDGECVVIAEHLANVSCKAIISNFDELLYTLSEQEQTVFSPDLLVTIGGHIVSKRIKQFLRKHKPTHHWHISPDGAMPDLFQSLTDVIESNLDCFLPILNKKTSEKSKGFVTLWKNKSDELDKKSKDYQSQLPFCDLSIFKQLFPLLPTNAALQLGNSSTIRNAQLFSMENHIPVYCNRGTSGIDGSLSTAVGFAAAHPHLTFLVIGDLSFFYDVNGLWNRHINKNLRILLINNEGGEIFHLLPGLNKAAALETHIACQHQTGAKGWTEAMGIQFLLATNKDELVEGMELFVSTTSNEPILFEVRTDTKVNAEIVKAYYHHLK